MIANVSQKFNKRAVILLFSFVCLILQTYLPFPVFISSIAILLYIATLGLSIGERFFDTKSLQWWGGIVLVMGSMALISTSVYYAYKLTPEISLMTTLLPLVFLYKKKKSPITNTKNPVSKPSRPVVLGIAIFFTLEITTLATIILARSGELMSSPWLAFDAWFFILFAVASALYYYLLSKNAPPKIMLIGAMVHFFIFYAIAAIVFKLGFGFDGFIHRATESWIMEHGFIAPKEPFYIGQYSLIVTLSRLSGIAIKYIDIFFIPVLASLSLPILAYSILPKAWNITRQTALALGGTVPFIFFLSFNLTTPHNFTLLLFVTTILSLVGYYYARLPYVLPLMLAALALSTHPLLGLPILAIVVIARLLNTQKNTKYQSTWCVVLVLFLSLIPLLMFTLQQWMNGYGLPTFVNPFSNLDLFLEFFRRPFWFKRDASWYLEIVYAWHYLLTPAVIMSAVAGAWYQKKNKLTWLLLGSSAGLTIGAFLLRTLITFPNVAESEQGNYPFRLLVAAVAVLIPLAMYGIYTFMRQNVLFLTTRTKLTVALLSIILSLKIGTLLMLSLYFSYPQYNGKVYFPGFNVTEYDQKAVRWIHDQNDTYDYVVLSTILTAVTALTEYPFASYIDTDLGPQFYYSIPSGGPLYLAYEEMVYHGQKRETIDKIFALTNVNTVYVVVPWYWARINEIVEGAKKSADSWHSIDDRMWVFEYLKHGN